MFSTLTSVAELTYLINSNLFLAPQCYVCDINAVLDFPNIFIFTRMFKFFFKLFQIILLCDLLFFCFEFIFRIDCSYFNVASMIFIPTMMIK